MNEVTIKKQKDSRGKYPVYVDGTRSGGVAEVKGGFQYIPKAGKKFAGEIMPTLNDILFSLVSEG